MVCSRGFQLESQCPQLVNEFLLLEHFFVGVVGYSLERNADTTLPGLNWQVLEQKLTTRSEHPLHLCQRVPPVRHVVKDPKIHNEVEAFVRELELSNVAFHESGIWQRARFSPGPFYHPRVQVDADVSSRAEQVKNDPGARSLSAADLEDIVRRHP
jgi:hypothetical protein